MRFPYCLDVEEDVFKTLTGNEVKLMVYLGKVRESSSEEAIERTGLTQKQLEVARSRLIKKGLLTRVED